MKQTDDFDAWTPPTAEELAAHEAEERENDHFKLIWGMNTLANTTNGMTTAPTEKDADAYQLPTIMLDEAASHVPKAFPDTLTLMLRAWHAPPELMATPYAPRPARLIMRFPTPRPIYGDVRSFDL